MTWWLKSTFLRRRTPTPPRVQLDAANWRAGKLAPKRYGERVQHTGGDEVSPVQTAIQITFVGPATFARSMRLSRSAAGSSRPNSGTQTP